MKRVVKASVDTDVQTIVDLARKGRNWQDMAFLKGSAKDVWYTIIKTRGTMPDGTPARLFVSEYIGNYDTGLYFERDFYVTVNGLLAKLRTPVVVERESDGKLFMEGHKRYIDRQTTNSSTRSKMKKVVRGSRGTAQDLINALNNRIDDIKDGTVASTEVTAMKSAFNRDAIRSQVEDYLGEYIKDYDVDGIVDEISDFETNDGSYVSNIDQIDPDEFQDVVRSHERNVAACSVKGATDFNENRISDELIDYLGDDIVTNDVEALFDELKETYPALQSIKDLPQGELDRLVRKYDESEPEEDSVEYQYSIEDTHGTPQAGLEVLDFETWGELEEYLDENPDVQKRIEEGYATIKEL